ncbi:DUF721 domain-containing protein [Nesterenkonia pannonica]|uniref:DUF721 domain-containing protein n=1 Tax=Nesterenkonia pannonica TaxID=1548602 RepID=UPI0021649DD9|nr:DUF721 domain-containing protein [Nesterenkonia pannonica]
MGEQSSPQPGQDGDEASIDAAAQMYRRFRRSAEQRGDRRAGGVPRSPAKSSGAASSGAGKGLAGIRAAPPFGAVTAEGGQSPGPEAAGRGGQRPDPQPGLERPGRRRRVISRWEALVGEAIAEHCQPESFEDGVVKVVCDSTAWATNLKLMQPQLLQVFTRELGPGIVTSLEIRGPRGRAGGGAGCPSEEGAARATPTGDRKLSFRICRPGTVCCEQFPIRGSLRFSGIPSAAAQRHLLACSSHQNGENLDPGSRMKPIDRPLRGDDPPA